MADKNFVEEPLVLDDTVKVNKRGEAILGRLEGPCADLIAPTRNGREYTEALWEKVFNNDIVKEYFNAGGILGELDHPADRVETCMEKVAICMPEPPKKDKNGKLVASFDILDTPNGRIAYTLAKYGYKLGVSSRGTGDVVEGADGKSYVDEDTYDFQAFDLVLLPAVKAARLKMVESYNGKTFKQAINEALEQQTPEGRKVMEDTLHNLNILDEEIGDESIDSKKLDESKADNDGLSVVRDLQESLKREKELKKTIAQLQEQLSVSNAKETQLKEEVDKYKRAVVTLSDSAKACKGLKSQVETLTQQLQEQKEQTNTHANRCKSLYESKQDVVKKSYTLTETINKKDAEIKSLKEQLEKTVANSEREATQLKEQLEEEKEKSNKKILELSTQVSKSKSIAEKYKGIAYSSVDRYIEAKADMVGVTKEEIKNRLSENYTFDDIDKVCNDLQEYQLNVSTLPFSISNKRGTRVAVKESKESIGLIKNADDEVDEQLINLIKSL